jgi:uncharacterized SAM-binding protein YcdF (DUF218 family)
VKNNTKEKTSMLEGHWIIKIPKKKTAYFVGTILILVFIIIFFIPFFADFLANWLTVRDNPVKSDIIFVLGGEGYRRVPFAMELYKKRYGKKVIITIGREDQRRIEAEKKYSIKPYDETMVNAILATEKIDPSIVTLLKDSLSTRDDASKLRNYYDKEKFSSVIVVTDPVHSRRGMMCIRWKFKDTDVKFYSYPLHLETYQSYFADRDDYVNFTFMEFLRYMYYFIGLKKQG